MQNSRKETDPLLTGGQHFSRYGEENAEGAYADELPRQNLAAIARNMATK